MWRHVLAAPLAGLVWHVAGCAGTPAGYHRTRHAATQRRGGGEAGADLATLRRAESAASAAGRKVLATGREMTVDRREILPGGCWDYANAVYNRAGFRERERETVFKTRKRGPYADAKLFRPGDWLFYVNHSYGGIEHSAIFVEWIDETARTALMLSYAGERRREPARYLPYDLSNVYAVVRPRTR